MIPIAPVDIQLQDTQANGSVYSVSQNSASAVDEQKINQSEKMLGKITSDLKQMVNCVFMHYAADDVAEALVQSTIVKFHHKLSLVIINLWFKP